MILRLTEEQQQLLDRQGDGPVSVESPDGSERYVLVRAERHEAVPAKAADPTMPNEIPPGIRQSQMALRRDLPRYLSDKKLKGKWVAYHGEACLGFASTETELYQACNRRGLREDEFYVGKVIPSELVEVEEIDETFHEFDEVATVSPRVD